MVALMNNKSPTKTEATIKRNIEATEVSVKLFDVTYGSFTEKILPSKANKFLHVLNRNELFFNIKLGLSTFMSNLFSYLDLTKDLTLLSSLIYAAYRIFESFIG